MAAPIVRRALLYGESLNLHIDNHALIYNSPRIVKEIPGKVARFKSRQCHLRSGRFSHPRTQSRGSCQSTGLSSPGTSTGDRRASSSDQCCGDGNGIRGSDRSGMITLYYIYRVRFLICCEVESSQSRRHSHSKSKLSIRSPLRDGRNTTHTPRQTPLNT